MCYYNCIHFSRPLSSFINFRFVCINITYKTKLFGSNVPFPHTNFYLNSKIISSFSIKNFENNFYRKMRSSLAIINTYRNIFFIFINRIWLCTILYINIMENCQRKKKHIKLGGKTIDTYVNSLFFRFFI